MLISKDDKFFVSGHNGMVGSAICRKLKKNGYNKLLTISRNDLDLRNTKEVEKWFSINKPDNVILAAAKVGGIAANSNFPTEFLLDNIKIQNNVIECCWKNNIKRLLFLGSSCIYPKNATQPIKEEELLSGYLEPTNESYALAKIVGLRLCCTLREQYKLDAISLMPTNLYGPGDNYNEVSSHVLAAFIRRFYLASLKKSKEVICWGSGNPYREFLHVDDLADACLFALENWDPGDKDAPLSDNGKPLYFLNIGTGQDLKIIDLAKKIASATNYNGKIIFDKSKPDGTPRKKLDVSRIKKLGWNPSITLEEGIIKEINNFSKIINI